MIGEEKLGENAKVAVTRFASLSKLGAEFEYNRSQWRGSRNSLNTSAYGKTSQDMTSKV
jgi:hypothetical protein